MVQFRTKKGKLVSFKAAGEKKPQKTASKGGRGRTRMAKKGKKNGGSKRQGLVSWLVNIASLGMILANPLSRMYEAAKVAGDTAFKFGFFARRMTQDYTGVSIASDWNTITFQPKLALRGWAPTLGGIAFKKGMGYATKTIKVQSLIPKLGVRM